MSSFASVKSWIRFWAIRLYRPLLAAACAWRGDYDLLRTTASLTTRNSQLTSDTFPLLELLADAGYREVYLISRSPMNTESLNYLTLSFDSMSIRNVSHRSDVRKALSRSGLVVYQDLEAMPRRYISSRALMKKRRIVHIDHGMAFNGGGYPNKVLPIASRWGIDDYNGARRIRGAHFRVCQNALHTYVAHSETYWRKATLQMTAERWLPLGYPKYLRARDLRVGNKEPVALDPRVLTSLYANGTKNLVLYAPHITDSIQSLGSHAWDDLGRLLEETSSKLIMRWHPEWHHLPAPSGAPWMEFHPREAFLSTVDTLAVCSVLITDRSSIASLAACMGIPVIHIDVGGDSHFTLPGPLARPGRVVDSVPELLLALGDALNNPASFEAQAKVHSDVWGLLDVERIRKAWSGFLETDLDKAKPAR